MKDWLSRFRGSLSVGLSALGVLIAVALGLVQCPGYWYIPAICVASFFFLLVTYPRPANIKTPLPGQFVPDNVSQSLLATAVRPHIYPLCHNLATSRACGTSFLAGCALEVATSIRHLLDKLDVLEGEMLGEKIYKPAKVEEHLTAARRLRGILSGITHCLSIECLRLFPEGESLYNDLCVLEYYFDARVTKPMENLLKGTAQFSDPVPEIRMALTNTLPRAIHRLRSPTNLPSAEDRARRILEGARKDWLNDLLALWRIDSCSPNPLSAPTPPKRILDFLGQTQ